MQMPDLRRRQCPTIDQNAVSPCLSPQGEDASTKPDRYNQLDGHNAGEPRAAVSLLRKQVVMNSKEFLSWSGGTDGSKTSMTFLGIYWTRFIHAMEF